MGSTGAIPGRIPNELRLLPFNRPLDATRRLAIADLANPYAEHPILQDGDLVLLSVQGPEGPRAHYLFRTRDFGFRTRFGAGLLVRLRVPLVAGDAEADLSPALAATLAVGYRPRTRSRPGLGDGAGRARHHDRRRLDRNRQHGPRPRRHRRRVQRGAGGRRGELFDFVSAQVLVNLSSFLRNGEESNVALAVGFDAVQFARFTERAGTRLLKRNNLQ